MANYYSPTVVLPSLPLADMTPIEQLLLTAMFDAEPGGDALYFFAEDSFDDIPTLEVDEVRAALAENPAGRTADRFRELLAELEPDAELLRFEDEAPWELTLQDIVRRSPTIHHVQVTTAFTCSKMRPDGFGGAVTIITAERVLSSSTEQMACELLDRAEYGDLACAPGFGSHVVLRLDEKNVREMIDHIFATQPPPGIDHTDVTNIDVRAACERVVAQADYAIQKRGDTLAAALIAFCLAAERKHAAR